MNTGAQVPPSAQLPAPSKLQFVVGFMGMSMKAASRLSGATVLQKASTALQSQRECMALRQVVLKTHSKQRQPALLAIQFVILFRELLIQPFILTSKKVQIAGLR